MQKESISADAPYVPSPTNKQSEGAESMHSSKDGAFVDGQIQSKEQPSSHVPSPKEEHERTFNFFGH